MRLSRVVMAVVLCLMFWPKALPAGEPERKTCEITVRGDGSLRIKKTPVRTEMLKPMFGEFCKRFGSNAPVVIMKERGAPADVVAEVERRCRAVELIDIQVRMAPLDAEIVEKSFSEGAAFVKELEISWNPFIALYFGWPRRIWGFIAVLLMIFYSLQTILLRRAPHPFVHAVIVSIMFGLAMLCFDDTIATMQIHSFGHRQAALVSFAAIDLSHAIVLARGAFVSVLALAIVGAMFEKIPRRRYLQILAGIVMIWLLLATNLIWRQAVVRTLYYLDGRGSPPASLLATPASMQ